MADESTAGVAAREPGPDAPHASPAGPTTGPAVASPGRRGTLLRAGFIVGMLVIVFGVILPQSIDYSEVIAVFRELDPAQVVFMTALGVAAWFVAGLVLMALVVGLSAAWTTRPSRRAGSSPCTAS